MPSKRPRKTEPEKPAKKRLAESSNENVDITNMAQFQQGSSSQLQLQHRVLEDSTLKSGKIKKILLKNFMCHSNFQVTLNKNVNVFVGLNGSGKSAILTALAIGLGSKASSTSRSTNLKDLVKRGETSATIEITLSNDGLDSFEEENYGKQITIVRNINGNSGASTYKLKSETGRVIASSRQDLGKLTLCLNIQVENPVLILNQDAARSFLKECDPKKLYQLFLKATQIEAIIEKLHSCLKCATSSKTQLEHLDRSIKQLEIEIIGIKEKHEKLQSVARLRSSIAAYKNELEWLKVAVVEKEQQEASARLVTKRKEVAKINDIVHNRARLDKELKDKICSLGAEFNSLTEVVTEKDAMSDSRRQEFEKEKDELSLAQQILRNLKERESIAAKRAEELQADLNERGDNPLNVDNMRKQNDLKKQQLNKKKEDLTLFLNNARRDHGQFTDTLNEYRDKLEAAQQHMKRSQESSRKCSAQIRQMQLSSQDALSVYGQPMVQLVKRIEQMYKQKKFAEMPRGPLGRYIEVTDAKYKQAVENILEGTLTSFFVSCDKDRIQMSNLLKEFGELSRTSIITGQFHNQVYDVRNGAVQIDPRHGRVLMNVIKVSDPVVMNCLIDQRQIEQFVLVQDTETAIEMTQDIENVPENLLRVVLLHPYSEYYPAPNYRSYAVNPKPVRFIQTSNKDVIADLTVEKNGHEKKENQISQLIMELKSKIRDQEKLIQEKRDLMKELQQKEQQYIKQLDEIDSIEYPEENETEYLRHELEELKKKQSQCARKVKENETVVAKMKDVLSQNEAQLTKCRDDARLARTNMTKMQTEMENAQQQLREMNQDIKSKTNQLVALRKDEDQFALKVEELNTKINQLTAAIRGERVPTERTEEVIQQLIRSADKRIRNIESNNENIEDVELLLKNKVQQVEKMAKVSTVLGQVLKTLEEIRLSRFHYIKRLRQHMSLRCKHKFNVIMGLRNYSAEAEIDHAEKTLTLKVIPRDSQVVDAVSNTKSLSGGERSYSTVAFLISLWSCVDHPFYFLDEYDVFSDEHNRHMMTKLLFNEAAKKVDKQYGFLTPQDFSNIEASPTITIHKLQDPDRMN